MGTERKQINVRTDDDTLELIEQLKPAVSKAIGIPVSVADLVRLGMQELARKYLTPEEEPKKGKK